MIVSTFCLRELSEAQNLQHRKGFGTVFIFFTKSEKIFKIFSLLENSFTQIDFFSLLKLKI